MLTTVFRSNTVTMNPTGILQIQRRVDRVQDAVTEAVAEDARDMAPIRTGELVESIRTVRLGDVCRVYVGTEHWQFMEYGTSPHWIFPKEKQALAWPQRGRFPAGGPVSSVFHPGNEPFPFMRPAIYQRRYITVTPTAVIVR